jgi:uncharacterized protein (TIGR03435 family)
MAFRMVFIVAAALTAMSQAQTPMSPPRRFDVASVKPNTGVERGVQIGFPSPGRFYAENVWLRFLIQNAWNVKNYQVVSGPAWAASERFDIDAKTDPSTPREQTRLMIQALLQDRFQLVLHHESRSLAVYHLGMAPKHGGKLQPSKKGSCIERDSEPAAAPGSPPPNYCGISEWSPRSLIGTAITMQQFTATLENILQRPVIDETGFRGTFDARLNWIPDQVTPGLLAPGVSPSRLPSANDAGPTIFSVLAEHLGLRLQAAKGMVDILVIDHAERPSGN